MPISYIVTYVKYLNSDLVINIWKKKKKKKKKKTEMEKVSEKLCWMKDLKVESRDMKLCQEF